MPELPEVETVVRDLRPQLSGRRIESLQVTRDQLVLGRLIRYPTARQFVQRLRGRTITSVTRRGKYIVMPLQDAAQGHAAARRHEAASPNGAGAERLIVHLGMTGHLRLWEPEEAPVKHTHVRLLLDSGLELRYDDQRQFGRLLLGTQPEIIAARAFPARLGPEPIHGDLTVDEFERLIHARRRCRGHAWPAAAPCIAASASAEATPLAGVEPPPDDHGRRLLRGVCTDHGAGHHGGV